MTVTVAGLGGLGLLLFGLFYWLNILPAPRAVIGFASVVAVGNAGMIGHGLTVAGSWVQHAFGSVMNWAIGVPLVAGLFIILAVIVIHDLHPKHTAGKRTGLMALALGALVVAGVAGIPALSGLHAGLVHVLANFTNVLNQAGR